MEVASIRNRRVHQFFRPMTACSSPVPAMTSMPKRRPTSWPARTIRAVWLKRMTLSGGGSSDGVYGRISRSPESAPTLEKGRATAWFPSSPSPLKITLRTRRVPASSSRPASRPARWPCSRTLVPKISSIGRPPSFVQDQAYYVSEAPATSAAPFGGWRHDAFRAQVHRRRAVHLVAVDDQAVERRRARHLVVALPDELDGVLIGRRREGIVAERERVGERLDDVGFGFQLLLELLALVGVGNAFHGGALAVLRL